jgi:hypothetical protein
MKRPPLARGLFKSPSLSAQASKAVSTGTAMPLKYRPLLRSTSENKPALLTYNSTNSISHFAIALSLGFNITALSTLCPFRPNCHLTTRSFRVYTNSFILQNIQDTKN